MCSLRSTLDLAAKEKNKDPKQLRLMREGFTNKGGGLSRCAKGSQARAGGYRAEQTNI